MSRRTRIYRAGVVVSLLLLACGQGEPSLPFDPHVNGLKLVKLIRGEDAIKAINQLHGMTINVVRGFIAHYTDGYDKATIWASEATSEDLAKRQVEVMIDKMKKSIRSPFSHYRILDVNGMRVIAFDGMGQVHYVFEHKKWVYWISADAGRMEMLLKHVCRTG